MVAIAAASWGTWSLFLRPTGLSTTVASPIVLAVMAMASLPLTIGEPPPRWDRDTLLLLAGNAACDALNVITFFAALRYTTVAIAVLTHYTAPILIALVAPRIDGVVTRGARGSAVIALVGLVIVLEPWHAPADGVLPGAALGLLSAACYSGNVFVVRRLATRIGNARAMAYHSAIAAVALLPAGAGGFAAVTAGDFALLGAGAATIGAGSGILFVAGLRRIGAARAAVLAYAEPLVAVVVGALAWHERVSALAAVGGVLVLAAGIHVARQAR
jgi:drug/metabolite transporter (DMT)-like permease